MACGGLNRPASRSRPDVIKDFLIQRFPIDFSLDSNSVRPSGPARGERYPQAIDPTTNQGTRMYPTLLALTSH